MSMYICILYTYMCRYRETTIRLVLNASLSSLIRDPYNRNSKYLIAISQIQKVRVRESRGKFYFEYYDVYTIYIYTTIPLCASLIKISD